MFAASCYVNCNVWTPLICDKIVEMRSATLGLPDSSETVLALDADQKSICRFASEDDDDYQRVSSLIVELVASANEPSLKSFSTPGPTYVAEETDGTYYMLIK